LIAARNGVPWIRRDDGPEKRLVPSSGHVLIYANDGTDFIEPVLNKRGTVTALKFHADGQASFRLETRAP